MTEKTNTRGEEERKKMSKQAQKQTNKNKKGEETATTKVVSLNKGRK